MAKGDPLEPLIEEAALVWWPAVIVEGERPQHLAVEPDVAEVAAFREVEPDEVPFPCGLYAGEPEDGLVARLERQTVAVNPANGVVLGELEDRSLMAKKAGQKVGDVVVLMSALVGGRPYLIGGHGPQMLGDSCGTSRRDAP